MLENIGMLNVDSDHAFTWDLVVLGAGSGGLAAAKRAAGYGKRVAVVEAGRVGGTCVIAGCIPKKFMWYASDLAEKAPMYGAYGFSATQPCLDFAALCAARDRVVAHLEIQHQKYLKEANVRLFFGRGQLLDAHTVVVEGASGSLQRLDTQTILLATGSTPRKSEVAGNDLALNSNGFFKRARLPAAVSIIGGGYIAVELAGILRSFGSQVTLCMRRRLLPSFDADLVQELREAMLARGIVIMEQTEVHHLEHTASQRLHVHLRNGQSLPEVDTVIEAIGRIPNSQHIGLDRVNVDCDTQGFIQVDVNHQTSCPNIFAIGDVIGRVNLTPVAIRAGRTFADWLCKHSHVPMSYEKIATAVFAHPPVASVGLSQSEAEMKLGAAAIQTFKTRFYPLFFSPGGHQTLAQRSFQKLVVEKDSGKVLGIHIMGMDAPEILQGFACALQAGITKAELDATLPIHPTQAEELVLMR